MKVDMEALRVLDTIIQEGSFAKAANRLHKAQSAVSYQIRKLEEQLNIDIFDRSQYRATLTPKGQALWTEARRMLQLAGRIESLAERYTEGWEPRLELVIDGALPMVPIMGALKALADRDIPTRIQVKVEALGGVQMRFEKDNADIMLAKDFDPHPSLTAVPLTPVSLVLVAASSHPLATEKNIELDQLHDHVELTINDTSEQSVQRPDSLQFGGDRVFYMHSFSAKKTAIEMGLGFGWMPVFQVRKELAEGSLVELNYRPGSRVSFTPMLVYRNEPPLGKAGGIIAELVGKAFQQFEG
ncbi:LysR family transcriptional regulator [Hahella sp. CCB-MM4]|uniref:LysR family transcriptional regulator n=1 Tax=Hahella sp. (strain CCB-MM4) TaxID=1926491 RepID=UPI000B9B01B7|nr:LysR family transcriptional regulator [Hahella sp. CCB-MM4]OZG74223.1 LysR family transcriptional regulator [Hahella sp. CCB-MM4]